MMHHRVVSDDGLRCAPSGFAIDVRLPWYRSLPLSVVEVQAVELDDQKIDLDRVRFELNGSTLSLGELPPPHQGLLVRAGFGIAARRPRAARARQPP
jgi:hypothetical protein